MSSAQQTQSKTFKPAPEFKSIADAPAWYPSLCIPRVFPNITWQYVKYVIEECCWGEVDRVDMVKKTNAKGEEFKRVFIHMKKWDDAQCVTEIREKLNNGTGDFKIYYENNDDGTPKPWFWKISKSRIARPEPKKSNLKMPSKTLKPTVVSGAPASAVLEEMRRMMAQQQETIARLSAMVQATATPQRPQTPPLPSPTMVRTQSPVYYTPVPQSYAAMVTGEVTPSPPMAPIKKTKISGKRPKPERRLSFDDDSDSDEE